MSRNRTASVKYHFSIYLCTLHGFTDNNRIELSSDTANLSLYCVMQIYKIYILRCHVSSEMDGYKISDGSVKILHSNPSFYRQYLGSCFMILFSLVTFQPMPIYHSWCRNRKPIKTECWHFTFSTIYIVHIAIIQQTGHNQP